MSLHPRFPTSPYEPLIPEEQWFPADEALRASAYEKLLPALVARCRFVFVDQKSFEQHVPQTFASLAATFTEHQKPS